MKYVNKYLLLLLLIMHHPVYGQEDASNENIHITNVESYVENDSLYVNFFIQAKNLRIPTWQSLALELVIDSGGRKAILPAILFSGKLRARYEKRNRFLAPAGNTKTPYQAFTGIRKKQTYQINYKASVPYGRWMNHAALTLRQTLEAGSQTRVNDQILCSELNPFIRE